MAGSRLKRLGKEAREKQDALQSGRERERERERGRERERESVGASKRQKDELGQTMKNFRVGKLA